MDVEEFIALLKSDGYAKVNRDIPTEAVDTYFAAKDSSDGVEALRRHGLTEFEIGFIVGFDEHGKMLNEENEETQRETSEAGMMFQ